MANSASAQADNLPYDSVRFASSAKVHPHADGTLQKYINHPAAYLHPIPDSCSYEQASLIEPLSVVLHAARRAGFTAGQSILVLGAGAVGLLGAAVANAHGATHIACADINEDRVQLALREGFVHKGYTLPTGPRPEDAEAGLAKAKQTANEIIANSAPDAEGFDIVLECTGVESCMQTAIHVSHRVHLSSADASAYSFSNLLPVCQNSWSCCLHWYGHTQCHVTIVCSRIPGVSSRS